MQKDIKVLVRIEVKAGPEVNPNYASIQNALLEEVRAFICFVLPFMKLYFYSCAFIDAEEDENK